MDQVCCAYEGSPATEILDGIHVHRKGHWSVANFVLPGVVRQLLRENRYDLLLEDINKLPFYTPLYSGGVPVLAVVPHLFGTTVYREANPVLASYVWVAEQFIPSVYRNAVFEVISPSTRDDLIARGLDADRIHTVFCGLEHEKFELADPPPRSPTPLVVC